MSDFDEPVQQENVSSEAAEGSDTTPTVLSETELDALIDRFMAHHDAWRGCHIFRSSAEQVKADKQLDRLCTEEVAGHA